MKFIKRNLVAFLVFAVVCLIIACLVWFTDNSCGALDNYFISVNDAFGVPFLFVTLIFELLIGVGVFLLFKKMVKTKFPTKYMTMKYLYFGILPMVFFHSVLFQIPNNISDRDITRSICDKSILEGLISKSKDINTNEYRYLQDHGLWLPKLPKTAENINLKYYADHFFGDFILEVTFICSKDEVIDTKTGHWYIKNPNLSQGKELIEYEIDNNSDKQKSG